MYRIFFIQKYKKKIKTFPRNQNYSKNVIKLNKTNAKKGQWDKFQASVHVQFNFFAVG